MRLAAQHEMRLEVVVSPFFFYILSSSPPHSYPISVFVRICLYTHPFAVSSPFSVYVPISIPPQPSSSTIVPQCFSIPTSPETFYASSPWPSHPANPQLSSAPRIRSQGK